MNTVFRKIVMSMLVASLVLAGLPLTSAYAAGPNDPPAPQATPNPQLVNARLQLAFARQTRNLEQIGNLYEKSGQGFAKIQRLIDMAKQHGQDVSQVQAALDAFKNALPKARPFYDQAKSIADSHKGFDASGNVTDPATARETIKGIHAALAQFKDAMGGTGKALHQAVLAFRAANPRPTPAPISSGG